MYRIVQELCESRGGRPGLSVLTSLLVSVDVKLYWIMLRHWSQLALICHLTSEDIKQHYLPIALTLWLGLQNTVCCSGAPCVYAVQQRKANNTVTANILLKKIERFKQSLPQNNHSHIHSCWMHRKVGFCLRIKQHGLVYISISIYIYICQQLTVKMASKVLYHKNNNYHSNNNQPI